MLLLFTANTVVAEPATSSKKNVGMGGGKLPSPITAEFLAYQQTLQKKIKANWKYATGKEQLKVRVLFSLASNGEISEIKVAESSGVPEFDRSAEKAVSDSNPLPPPPAKEIARFKKLAIVFDSQEK